MKWLLGPERETSRSEKTETVLKGSGWVGKWPSLDLPGLGPTGEVVGCRDGLGLQKKLEQRCGGENRDQSKAGGWAGRAPCEPGGSRAHPGKRTNVYPLGPGPQQGSYAHLPD